MPNLIQTSDKSKEDERKTSAAENGQCPVYTRKIVHAAMESTHGHRLTGPIISNATHRTLKGEKEARGGVAILLCRQHVHQILDAKTCDPPAPPVTTTSSQCSE